MITVRLQGGLGNQMFQYSVGRALAHQHRTSVALDLSFYQQDKLREYCLGVFDVNPKFDGFPRLDRRRSFGQRLRLPGFAFELGRVRLPGFTYVVKEKTFTFEPAVLDAPDNVYLDGFWQSEKYFSQAEDIIRREFRLKAGPSGQNAEMANKIAALNGVSVHVRRTDYLSKVGNICCALPLEYYRKAVLFLASRVSNPHFFVFSDEPDWTRANLDFKRPATFVAHNGPDNGHEDLRLMALCRHHIIANSTFSWWGAWLSNSKGTVVAPKEWFDTTELNTRDLIPAEWIRL